MLRKQFSFHQGSRKLTSITSRMIDNQGLVRQTRPKQMVVQSGLIVYFVRQIKTKRSKRHHLSRKIGIYVKHFLRHDINKLSNNAQ